MKTQGSTKLYVVAGTQSAFVLPADTIRLDIQNPGGTWIRYAFVTGKVAVPAFPYEFETLAPASSTICAVKKASGSLYYSGNGDGAEFYVKPYTE